MINLKTQFYAFCKDTKHPLMTQNADWRYSIKRTYPWFSINVYLGTELTSGVTVATQLSKYTWSLVWWYWRTEASMFMMSPRKYTDDARSFCQSAAQEENNIFTMPSRTMRVRSSNTIMAWGQLKNNNPVFVIFTAFNVRRLEYQLQIYWVSKSSKMPVKGLNVNSNCTTPQWVWYWK